MGTYKAKKNSQELDDEPKSYEEQKRESTEKAVDLAGEAALDYFTGGKGSKIKNMAENVPIVGNTVKNSWDGAVKKVSKAVSKTPAGDMLKKADDAGVTDMARTAKDAMSMKGGGGSLPSSNNGNSTESLKNTNKSGGLSNLIGGTNSKGDSNLKMFGSFKFELPLVLKIKIIITLSCIFLLFIMVVAVFAQDDIKNLSLTNNSEMTPKGGRKLTQAEIENRLVYVGDSRISSMESSLSNDNIDFISGSGYDWLSSDGINKLENILNDKSDAIVVISSGINDLNNIDNYITLYKDLMSKHPDVKIFIMSVNPVDESKTNITNNQIEGFNKKLSESFGVNYIDTYSGLSNIVTKDDGITYETDLNNEVNNIVTNTLMNSGQITSTVVNGDVKAKLEEMAYWYINNVNKYSMNETVYIPLLNASYRKDCSGFAVAYMSYVAGVNFSGVGTLSMVNPNDSWAQKVSEHGWKAYTSDQIGSVDNLQLGDVLIADNRYSYSKLGQHAEVYVDSSHTFGWGTKKTKYPSDITIRAESSGGHIHLRDSIEKHDYITVYRYEGA